MPNNTMGSTGTVCILRRLGDSDCPHFNRPRLYIAQWPVDQASMVVEIGKHWRVGGRRVCCHPRYLAGWPASLRVRPQEHQLAATRRCLFHILMAHTSGPCTWLSGR